MAHRREMLFAGLPFSSAFARDGGLTRRALARLLADGAVRRFVQGVYVDAAVPDSVSLRALALALVAPEHAVVCRSTAAWLYGVDVHAPGAHLLAPAVELVVPEGCAAVRRPGCPGYSARLDGDDVVAVAGLRVTTPLRTTLDLARWRPRPEALAAVDAMLHAGLVRLPELLAGIERFAGERHVARARALLRLAEPATESPMESWLRLRVLDAGFPRPVPQYEVRDESGLLVARLDLGYPKWCKGLEYDGEEHHSEEADVRHDEARRDDLHRRGWEIRAFRRAHVLGRGTELERAVGELLGLEPKLPRRTW